MDVNSYIKIQCLYPTLKRLIQFTQFTQEEPHVVSTWIIHPAHFHHPQDTVS